MITIFLVKACNQFPISKDSDPVTIRIDFTKGRLKNNLTQSAREGVYKTHGKSRPASVGTE